MPGKRVVVLGGGLAGMATAYGLSLSGWDDITLVERGQVLGGLAGSFQQDGRSYPLGYHHILARDRPLLDFLELIGAAGRVRWRKVRMLFESESGLYDLGHPFDFARFPMPLASKARFARLMMRAMLKRDWSDWSARSGEELIDATADPVVRRTLFEPLVQLKFRLSCAQISAEWLGVRLSYREGAAPLGYIPDTNWTTVLCDGVEQLLRRRHVAIRTSAPVTSVDVRSGRAVSVTLASDERVGGDVFVSTMPTRAYLGVCPSDQTPQLRSIDYTALLSMVCGTSQPPEPDFYWLNLATRRHSACGLFNLSALNPTIGSSDDTCLNFVTHLRGNHANEFERSETEIIDGYLQDYRRIFGRTLQPSWVKLSRVPMYSPVFVKGYAPPPTRSTTLTNMYFAGNYCGAPTIASTGSALSSGLETARSILLDEGMSRDVLPAMLSRVRS